MSDRPELSEAARARYLPRIGTDRWVSWVAQLTASEIDAFNARYDPNAETEITCPESGETVFVALNHGSLDIGITRDPNAFARNQVTLLVEPADWRDVAIWRPDLITPPKGPTMTDTEAMTPDETDDADIVVKLEHVRMWHASTWATRAWAARGGYPDHAVTALSYSDWAVSVIDTATRTIMGMRNMHNVREAEARHLRRELEALRTERASHPDRPQGRPAESDFWPSVGDWVARDGVGERYEVISINLGLRSDTELRSADLNDRWVKVDPPEPAVEVRAVFRVPKLGDRYLRVQGDIRPAASDWATPTWVLVEEDSDGD